MKAYHYLRDSSSLLGAPTCSNLIGKYKLDSLGTKKITNFVAFALKYIQWNCAYGSLVNLYQR